MGLDMYLTANKHFNTWSKADEQKNNSLKSLMGFPEKFDKVSLSEVVFRAMYWRKANQIHSWFVTNVQGGVDNCQTYHVSRVMLEKLVEDCNAVLSDKSRVQELVPPVNGFFFGSTDIDDYYFKVLAQTASTLQEILNEPFFNDCSFYYMASW